MILLDLNAQNYEKKCNRQRILVFLTDYYRIIHNFALTNLPY